MAQSVRAKSTNEATAESLAGIGIIGLFLIVFVIPTTGYIIYMFKTPWKFKTFQEYGVEFNKIKKLKVISIILSIASIALILILPNQQGMSSLEAQNLFFSLVLTFFFVSLLFLLYSIKVTKDEREKIKQIKKFIIEYNNIINKKEAIMQQAVSMHNRNSNKYNSILEDEINDIIQKIQNKFDFSPTILEKIKQDTTYALKEM